MRSDGGSGKAERGRHRRSAEVRAPAGRQTFQTAHRCRAGSLAIIDGEPTPAQAHGIRGDAAGLSTYEFVALGIEHMALGWDHLLFVAGILLIAKDLSRSAKLISLFVLGHSTTLIVGTLAGWRFDAGYVDAVIAASVAVVGVIGILTRPQRWNWFAAMVLGFGLIHGLGLATRFQDLDLPSKGRLWKLLAFNIGLELGQLTAILVMVTFAKFVTTRATQPDSRRLAAQLTSGGLFIGGSVAASLVAFSAASGPPDPGARTPGRDTANVLGPLRRARPDSNRESPRPTGPGPHN